MNKPWNPNAHASAVANPLYPNAPEIIVGIYGPRGGTKACFGLSPDEARRLAGELLAGADHCEGNA